MNSSQPTPGTVDLSGFDSSLREAFLPLTEDIATPAKDPQPQLPARNPQLALVRSAIHYPALVHLAALRISAELQPTFKAVMPCLKQLWAEHADTLGSERPCKSRDEAADALRQHIPSTWKRWKLPSGVSSESDKDCLVAEIPQSLWWELGIASRIRSLNVLVSSSGAGGSASLMAIETRDGVRESFCIRIGLNPSNMWFMLLDEYVDFLLPVIICHELTHIINYWRTFETKHLFYNLSKGELVAIAAGCAMEWVKRHGDRQFELQDTVNFFSPKSYREINNAPKVFDCLVSGKRLLHWQACFVRLVKRHIRHNLTARSLLAMAEIDGSAYSENSAVGRYICKAIEDRTAFDLKAARTRRCIT